jgi:hypothetical protein
MQIAKLVIVVEIEKTRIELESQIFSALFKLNWQQRRNRKQ